MKKIYQLIPLIVLLFTSLQSQASHVVGADVSYTCTNTPGVYKVTLKVYRDCAGINLCTGCQNPIPNGTTAGCTTANAGFSTPITGADGTCNGASFGNYTLAAVSGTNGYDIIQTCDSAARSVCTNCNTRTAGTFSPGIEIFIFEGNVDLRSLPSACCKVRLGFSICCRNSAITLFVPGNFYADAIVDRCITPCNNAPIFTNEARTSACAGADFVYNLGAIDPDGDSLSYELGESFQGPGAGVTWNPPFNAGYPFNYLGAPNRNATYPGGLRVDPITGDVLFRPQGVFVSNLVIEVKQWRKISGVYVNVGATRRDVQIQTALCGNNLIPLIKVYRNNVLQSAQSFNAKVGEQICLDIVAEDQARVSPSIINADTTYMGWNNPGLYDLSMANATWVANYIVSQRAINGPKADSFKFCWTPPLSAMRTAPHSFNVRGRDFFCNLSSSSNWNVIRGINITVSDKAISIDSNTKKQYCNNKSSLVNMAYRASASTNLMLGNVFTAELSDSAGSFNNATVIGSKTDTSRNGTITINIPSGLKIGNSYAIRVRTSSDTNSSAVPYPISVIQGIGQASIINNGDSVCKGNPLLLRALPNTDGLNYRWLVNNNVLTGATNDTLYTDTAAALRVIVSNAVCSDTSSPKTLTIYPKPSVGFTSPSIICLPSAAIVFGNTTSISSGSLNYQWRFSDNTSSTNASPIKLFTDTGSITVKLVATSNRNCTDSLEKTMAIRRLVQPAFSINDTIQCLKNNVFGFTNQTNNMGLTLSYTWKFGIGNDSSTNNNVLNYSYTNAGNYTIRLATNNVGCIDSAIRTVNVLANATNVNFAVNADNQCSKNNNFVFVNNASPNNSNIKYFWQFGNGDTSTQRAPVYRYQSVTGTFPVKLKVTTFDKCVDSFTSNVFIKLSPSASFTISDTIPQCLKGNNYNFTNTSANAQSYNWQANNVFITGNTNVNNYKFNASGVQGVRLIANNNGCFDTIIKTVTILANATSVNFSVNATPQCLRNNNFVFTNNSLPNDSNTQYYWQFGNTDYSTLRSPSYKYKAIGIYPVKLRVTTFDKCIDSFVSNINVNVSPTANFDINDSLQCLRNNRFVFTNTSLNFITNKWTLGDNTTSTGTSPAPKTYANAGNYTVKLVTNANGCLDSISKTISVVTPASNIGFTINKASQCLVNNNFIFTNTSTPDNTSLSYLWTLDNGNTTILRNSTAAYSSVGTYKITLKVTANQKCIDSISQTIRVNAQPVIGPITGNTAPSNPGLPFSYSVATQPNTTNYNWTVNNGTIQSGQGSKTVSILFTNKGAAKIFAQITDSSTCSDTTSLAINVQNVGVQNIAIQTALSVYPNPSKTQITISNKSRNLLGREYRLSNLIGQTVLSGKLNTEETSVNIESLSSGVYLLSIEGLNSQNIKVVKE
jgi:PKD repeat protein